MITIAPLRERVHNHLVTRAGKQGCTVRAVCRGAGLAATQEDCRRTVKALHALGRDELAIRLPNAEKGFVWFPWTAEEKEKDNA